MALACAILVGSPLAVSRAGSVEPGASGDSPSGSPAATSAPSAPPGTPVGEPVSPAPGPAAPPAPAPSPETHRAGGQAATHRFAPIRWRHSRAVGLPFHGRLFGAVRLPPEGKDFFTWNAVLKTKPNRWWRRNGTDRLIRLILRVADAYRARHPDAPRLAIGDLSRPHGGRFGSRYGGLGHHSHQNGLDVDIFYPRRDRRERAPRSVRQIDHRLAQDLVNRFVRAHVQFVFVGPHTRLKGPRSVVQPLVYHDEHMHVRIRR